MTSTSLSADESSLNFGAKLLGYKQRGGEGGEGRGGEGRGGEGRGGEGREGGRYMYMSEGTKFICSLTPVRRG